MIKSDEVIKLLEKFSSEKISNQQIQNRKELLNNLLLEAAKNDDHSLVQLAILFGADINYALAIACLNGLTKSVKLLIDHGADVTTDNNFCIAIAAQNGHVKVVKLLIEYGADVSANNNYAIRNASRNRHHKVVELLTKAGANLTS